MKKKKTKTKKRNARRPDEGAELSCGGESSTGVRDVGERVWEPSAFSAPRFTSSSSSSSSEKEDDELLPSLSVPESCRPVGERSAVGDKE